MALATAFGVDLERLKPPTPGPAEPLQSPAAQSSAAPVCSDQPKPAKSLPYLYYRLLRFVVLVGLLVGLDVYATGRVTWSRWILVLGVALFVLRVIRAQFVEPGEVRRRRSISRNA